MTGAAVGQMAGGKITDKIIIDRTTIKFIVYAFWWTLERGLLRHAGREPMQLHNGTAVVAAAVGHQCARALLESRASSDMHMRRRDPSRRFPELKINLRDANARALHRRASGKGSGPNEEGYDYPERCGDCNAVAP